MPGKEQTRQTRERLLEAAAEVFAEEGYRNARVRTICERAGANVAAVNYHFGDKQRLYDATLRYAFFTLSGGDPTQWGVPEGAGVEEHLLGFIRTLLTELLTEGRSALYPKLVARELTDPTDALQRLVDEGIRPQIDILVRILGELLGEDADETDLRRCLGSILGQCLYYYFARPVIRRLGLDEESSAETIESRARHILRFSLAGVRSYADGDRP